MALSSSFRKLQVHEKKTDQEKKKQQTRKKTCLCWYNLFGNLTLHSAPTKHQWDWQHSPHKAALMFHRNPGPCFEDLGHISTENAAVSVTNTQVSLNDSIQGNNETFVLCTNTFNVKSGSSSSRFRADPQPCTAVSLLPCLQQIQRSPSSAIREPAG